MSGQELRAVIDRIGHLAIRPAAKDSVVEEGDLVDRSGEAIIALLDEASDSAKASYDEAMNRARMLSNELRGAEDKIKALEAEVQVYVDRATIAEKWLARVHKEIERAFFSTNSGEQPRNYDDF